LVQATKSLECGAIAQICGIPRLGSTISDAGNGGGALADLLIDSDVLIHHTRGNSDAAEFLRAHAVESRLCSSSINEMELLTGTLDRSEQRQIERFLKRFEIIKIDEAICDQAVRYVRRFALSHRLQAPDALIAATATVCRMRLATGNPRDYGFIPGLKVIAFR